MNRAVVIDCLRTPVGRAHKQRGVFRNVRSRRSGRRRGRGAGQANRHRPGQIEDVVLGNTQQQGEQGFNVARFVALMAGLPMSAGGTTVNRLCGSSLQAINQAAHAIVAGAEDVQIVGGLEHMQHIPMDAGFDLNPKLFRRTSRGALLMGVTAEFLAQTQGISREEQDAFALRSHQLAGAAHSWAAISAARSCPIWGHDEAGNRILVDHDQCVRPDCTADGLAALKPAFMPGMGTVTAGNSSPLNDGAAALLDHVGRKGPCARPQAAGANRGHGGRGRRAGRDGHRPGAGHAKGAAASRPATGRHRPDRAERGLRRAGAGLHPNAGLDESKVNVRGGAIAIGHPLGASGARIATTLIPQHDRSRRRLGLATMCIGVGQGIATIFERV